MLQEVGQQLRRKGNDRVQWAVLTKTGDSRNSMADCVARMSLQLRTLRG